MRMTCGAPGGSAACRALAAAITSMTRNGGTAALRPTFSTGGSYCRRISIAAMVIDGLRWSGVRCSGSDG